MCALFTGAIWCYRRFYLLPKHGAQPLEVTHFWTDQIASFFPLLLLVIVIRSFIIEPFRIPSGSLEPSLLIGDFVAVNKFSYGLRLPVTDTKIFQTGEPERGDIAVFSWPPAPKFDYIKRVIGKPGDTIRYDNKVLTINGKVAKQTFIEFTNFVNQYGQSVRVKKIREEINGVSHDIFVRTDEPAFNFEIKVPKGHYFMMGDNRDDSSDSRYWGFLPEKNLRGKAFMVWMSWNSLLDKVRWSRIGHWIK